MGVGVQIFSGPGSPLVHLDLISVWTTKNSISTSPILDLAFGYEQAHAFLWTTKFQSVQVNPKTYWHSLATKALCLSAALDVEL